MLEVHSGRLKWQDDRVLQNHALGVATAMELVECHEMSKKKKPKPKPLPQRILESNLTEQEKRKAVAALESLKAHVPRLTEQEVDRIADAAVGRLVQAWKTESLGARIVEPKEKELKAKFKTLAWEIGIAVLGSAAWELLFWVFTQTTAHFASATPSPEDSEFTRKRAELAEHSRAGLSPETVRELNKMDQLIYFENLAILEEIKREFSGDPDFMNAAGKMKEALMASDNFEDFEYGSFFHDICQC